MQYVPMLILIGLITTGAAVAAPYTIDTAHSSVGFEIRHLVARVSGGFTDFKGTIVFAPADPAKSKVEAIIQTASISTNNQQRDTHLRSADFFDAATYPTLTFTSTKVEKLSPTKGKVHGTLTLHGVSKVVVLEVEYLGQTANPFDPSKSKLGFVATTTINRKDFGLSWNKVLDKGSLLLGEEVKIVLNIEADGP